MALVASRSRLAQLRRHIEKLEGRHGESPIGRRAVACGPVRLAQGSLHEFRAGDYRDAPSAYGLALAAAGKMVAGAGKPAVLIKRRHEILAAGRAYGLGLCFFGLRPEDQIIVYPKSAQETLWAAEEAASAAGVGAVIIEFFTPHRLLDLTATRRLQLAAERSGTTPILLRSANDKEPSAARTRWAVRAAPSASDEYDLKASGNPRWRVELERCREGGRGAWVLEWDHANQDLREAAALRGRAAAALADRPAEEAAAVA